LGPFSYLTVCVYTLNATAQIDQISTYTVIQSGTNASLYSIVDGEPSQLTILTFSKDKRTACIKTQLYSSFFEGLTSSNKDQHKLAAQGSVQIRLANEARRLAALPKPNLNFSFARKLKQRESKEENSSIKESAFKVDQISLQENIKFPIIGVIGIIFGLFLMAGLAILAVFWIYAKKKSKHP
jgi:hypothetical protein